MDHLSLSFTRSVTCSMQFSSRDHDQSVSRYSGDDQNAEGNDQLNESFVMCNVCFEIESDAIFMACGHGGLCLKCSYDIWKSTGECYLCREPIDYILRYDNSQKKNNQFKIIELHQEN